MPDQASENRDASLPLMLGVESSVSGRAWRARANDDRAVLSVSQQLDIPEILARIVVGRGIEQSEAPIYLDPSLKDQLPDPSLFKDMDSAAKRIVKAVQNQEKVAIFGDYDVDGATSSAVLARYFRSLKIDPLIYIPDRMSEGYGPNREAFKKLKEQGAGLVITVDCGTLAFDPLEYAEEIGLEVIVVDHHQAEGTLPKAKAVINPNRLDDTSGHGYLAAVGVAYLLVIAINRALRNEGWFEQNEVSEPDLLSLLDLVALGTVCDVVPLKGVNRAFVKQGLKVMSRRGNLGISTLSDVAKIDGLPGTYELGFLLGPRVNAGGRVGKSDLGSRLLTTEDAVLASDISIELDRLNQERKAIETQVQSAALSNVESLIDAAAPPAFIMAVGEYWHPGVIGIVASRLKDRYRRPAFVIAVDENGVGKGSGRSIPGVDLGGAVVAALNQGLLTHGGGHAMAAGLTVAKDQIDGLRDFLEDHLKGQVEKAGRAYDLKLDGVLSPSAAKEGLIEILDKAAPFGAANSEPQFAFPNVRVVHSDIVGENHVRCVITGDGGARLKGIAFRCADEPLGEALLGRKGEFLHIAGKIRRDTWAGNGAVQLMIEDAALPKLGNI